MRDHAVRRRLLNVRRWPWWWYLFAAFSAAHAVLFLFALRTVVSLVSIAGSVGAVGKVWWVPLILIQPAAGATLPWMFVLRSRSKRQREESGLCPACGYDMRATPERCSECGIGKQGG